VLSLSLAAGVYLGHPSSAHAENCNPKNPSVCVGGPTGPAPSCGEVGLPCCHEPVSGLYCTDNDAICADVNGKYECVGNLGTITFGKK
jgi:hypothetical protein